ncbi:hypothetical protein N431DRAFT_467123 [Stipitochalara longipes BDJ]|nr:hypothetical protein N431DRAFT_467123 [Stipitochalara longipes BDJ]
MSPTPKTEDEETSINTPFITKSTCVNAATATCTNNAVTEGASDFAEEAARAPSSEIMNTEHANSSYVHDLGMDMVIFRFGDEILPSSIHQNVICKKIPGFRKYLPPSQPGHVEVGFPSNMEDVIGTLIEYCYTSKLPKVNATTLPQQCYIMIKLYCLAAKFGQVDLMNRTIDYILAYLGERRPRWDVEWATYVYNNTDCGSPLRNLMTKWFLHKFARTNDKGRWTTEKLLAAATAHPDMMLDVFVLLRSIKIKAKHPRKDDPDTYHSIPSNIPDPEFRATPESDVENSADTLADFDGDEMYDVRPEDRLAFDNEEDEGSSSDELLFTRSGRSVPRPGKRSFTAPA